MGKKRKKNLLKSAKTIPANVTAEKVKTAVKKITSEALIRQNVLRIYKISVIRNQVNIITPKIKIITVYFIYNTAKNIIRTVIIININTGYTRNRNQILKRKR